MPPLGGGGRELMVMQKWIPEMHNVGVYLVGVMLSLPNHTHLAPGGGTQP